MLRELTLRVLLLEISFYLPGCRSLKEKRRRLRGIADKVGNSHQIALAESGSQDDHQKSVWSFVLIAANQGLIDQLCARIETVSLDLDAVISDINRQWLS